MKSLECKEAKKAAKLEKKMQRKNRPVYKKWWFWIIVVLAVLMIGSALSGGDEETKDSGTTNSTKQEEKAKPKKTEQEMTVAQKNAYQSAKDYLATMAFSREGLLDQLTSEYGDNYKRKDALFAIKLLEKNGEVDWNEEAKRAAKEYLDSQSFSEDGLIDQLESEYGSQFTHEQAVQAVKAVYK